MEKFPKIEVRNGLCTVSGLRRIINLHKNKAKDKCLKTKKERKVDEVTEVECKEEDEMEDETYPIEP